jgi:hypothetical protein
MSALQTHQPSHRPQHQPHGWDPEHDAHPHHGNNAGHPHHKSLPHVLLEIAEYDHKVIDKIHNAAEHYNQIANHVRMFSGPQAAPRLGFWKTGVFAEKTGVRVGAVVSRQQRMAYLYSVNVARSIEKIGPALVVAGAMLEFAHDFRRVQHIWFSKNSEVTSMKIAHTSCLASMAIFRAFTGVVPEGAHLLAKVINARLSMEDALTGHVNHAAITAAKNSVDRIDHTVSVTYKDIYDGEHVWRFFNSNLFFFSYALDHVSS